MSTLETRSRLRIRALDLTSLRRVDAEGSALLNAPADAGAQRRHVSPYIALRLRHSRR
jgi:hypothetical protein